MKEQIPFRQQQKVYEAVSCKGYPKLMAGIDRVRFEHGIRAGQLLSFSLLLQGQSVPLRKMLFS